MRLDSGLHASFDLRKMRVFSLLLTMIKYVARKRCSFDEFRLDFQKEILCVRSRSRSREVLPSIILMRVRVVADAPNHQARPTLHDPSSLQL